GIARLHGAWPLWRRWWLATWLVLITHPLLDALTIYGTQLALPFSNHPYGLGSVFVIDPLYTLPLLLGLLVALLGRSRPGLALRANALGLALSTAYLLWGLAAQQHVRGIAQASLARQGMQAQALLVMPSAFNSVLWRVVATTPTQYHEGFYSLLDAQAEPLWETHERGAALMQAYAGHPAYERLHAFAKGFVAMQAVNGRAHLSDLRMGQTPTYTFSFDIGAATGPGDSRSGLTEYRGRRPELARALPWLWDRLRGEPLPPPH
ncbi:MAG: metal-dependent hydrolase, partial [Curvibacter sp.]